MKRVRTASLSRRNFQLRMSPPASLTEDGEKRVKCGTVMTEFLSHRLFGWQALTSEQRAGASEAGMDSYISRCMENWGNGSIFILYVWQCRSDEVRAIRGAAN